MCRISGKKIRHVILSVRKYEKIVIIVMENSLKFLDLLNIAKFGACVAVLKTKRV